MPVASDSRGRWNDDLHHGLHAVLTGERTSYFVDYDSVDAVARALGQVHHLDGRWSRHPASSATALPSVTRHDTGSSWPRRTTTRSAIGPAASGSSTSSAPARRSWRQELVLLAPFTPLIFQGEEWGASAPFRFFADFQDAALREAVIEGRSEEFAELGQHEDDIADPFALETFEQCRLRWDEREDQAHAEMLDWYRRLLALRRAEPELTDPRPVGTQVECDGDVVVMHRGSFTVLANFGDHAHGWRPGRASRGDPGQRQRERSSTTSRSSWRRARWRWSAARTSDRAMARAERTPRFVEPMLATAAALPTDEELWAYEVKWDGIRVIARVAGRALELSNRSGIDITTRYPDLAAGAAHCGDYELLLDGEVVALDEAGRPSFERLQRRMHVVDPAAQRRLATSVPVHLVVFDVLWSDRKSLLRLPYVERRDLLAELDIAHDGWTTPSASVGASAPIVAFVENHRLEGVVAKRLDSAYLPGARSSAWVKQRSNLGQELLVCGWIDGTGVPRRWARFVGGRLPRVARRADHVRRARR